MKSRNKIKTSNLVRIIGGRYKGRKLTVIDSPGLRPTGNRIRETVFNWLAPYIEEATCIDLFAGSGALGIEAASRGAKQCVLLENHQATYNAIQQSLRDFSCSNAQAVRTDATHWLCQYQGAIDIAFVDPPFAENLHNSSLSILCAHPGCHDDTVIYVEAAKGTAISVPQGWYWFREKQTGDVFYGLLAQQLNAD